MLVVGLTGGISSGKSTVAALFIQKNVPVVDADEIARKITEPGNPAFDEIIILFGKEVILPDGRLNRARLRERVFTDAVSRKKLEQVLHPLIRTEMKIRIETLNAPYCIAMIPLLLETTPNPLIQRILVVDAPEKLQISRTTSRDKIQSESAQDILAAQINRQKRLELADDVILNQGAVEDLIPQVDKLHEFYLELANKTLGAC